MKHTLLTILCCWLSWTVFAQVTTSPAIVQKGYKGEIVVTFDPTQGNGKMAASKNCYAHIGLITNKSKSDSDWQYATEWQKTDKAMTRVGDNWQLVITPNLYAYYGCPETEEILRLAFVFHDGVAGGKEGKAQGDKDIFVVLADAGLAAGIDADLPEIAAVGQSYTLTCHATAAAEMTLFVNNTAVQQQTGTNLTYTHTLTEETNYTYLLRAVQGTDTAYASTFTCVPAPAVTKVRPSGIDMGIYYESDPTRVTLSTFAAHCQTANDPSELVPESHVFVVGDFNNWTLSNDYQFYRDGNYFWLTIDQLTPKREYAFQYVVVRSDGVIKHLTDLYSEKILDSGDGYTDDYTPSCPRMVDPTLVPYPAKADGSYVSILQTGKEAFAWSDATLNFQRPDKNNLIIYETWIYDFTPTRSIAGMMERLDYLQNLGINCLELMPVCEFDGNNSWGYSPNHYFALDKTYGRPEELKTLIDECHRRGIAVVIDMVFNHATGNNPMNKLWPATSATASKNELRFNPWFNTVAPHPDNVYEDWNHDFEPARNMFNRALTYWLTEYRVDGFRFDLSHGYCGKSYNAPDNLRIYYQTAQTTSPGCYFMLEHWDTWDASSSYPAHKVSDRGALVSEGMMCWQNTSNAFYQTAMGWLKDGDDLTNANMQGYVSYSDNHDEERTFFKARQWGVESIASDLATRCGRVALTLGFQCMLAGPQLFYHFTELGFDYSKFQNRYGQWGGNPYNITNETGDSNDGVKMQVKARPERLGWFAQGPRMEAYQRLGKILQLRTRLMPEVFAGEPTNKLLGTGQGLRYVQWSQNVYAVANFSATRTQTVTMPNGIWYDYLDGGNRAESTYTLQPGEIKVFTGKALAASEMPDSYDFVDAVMPIWETPEGNTRKVLYNGQIIILREDGSAYTLTGNRLR